MKALLVSGNPRTADAIREMLRGGGGASLALEWTPRLETALGRVAENEVDVVLLDSPEHLSKLRSAAHDIPVILLSDQEDESLALESLREGAQDYLVPDKMSPDALARSIRYAIARKGQDPPRKARKRGRVLAFWGAKGGVGTTTLVANIAAGIATSTVTVLALDLRGWAGGLRRHFANARPSGDIGTLLDMAPEHIDGTALTRLLCGVAPGLSLLCAPDQAMETREIRPEQAERILDAAAGLADYVLVDLPAAPLPANGAAIGRSATAVIVCDRAPDSLASAQLHAARLRQWASAALAAGIVVVNRVPLASPLPLPEISARLGHPIFAVIPPAADACALAYQAGLPLVLCQPDTRVGYSFLEAARNFAAHPVLKLTA